MRCPDCSKFAAYDDSTEPEVELDYNDDGTFSGEVRIVLLHDECSMELKEASFSFEGEVPDDILAEHKGDDHDLSLEVGGTELVSRGEGKGRYMKTFYGHVTAVELSCSCQTDGLWASDFADDIQASYMDELV